MLITQVKFFKCIEWIFFFLLSGLSFYFMYGVLNEYFSGTKSFSNTRILITELPTVTICFSSNGKSIGDIEYKYQVDFEIEYEVDWDKSIGFIKEGVNYNDFNETIKLEEIITIHTGICYKITALSNSGIKGKYRSIIFYFNTSIPHEMLPYILVYFTSEKNAPGILNTIWYEGEIDTIFIEKDIYIQCNLQVVKHDFLKSKSNCRDESYYECFAKILYLKLNICFH